MRNGYDVSTPAFTAINPNGFNSEDYQEKQNRKGIKSHFETRNHLPMIY